MQEWLNSEVVILEIQRIIYSSLDRLKFQFLGFNL